MFWPTSKWVWAFTAIALAQAGIVLGFEAYIFATFQTHLNNDRARNRPSDPTKTIPTFLTLYIFAFVYQLFLVWDALRLKNTIQVIGLVFLNVGLLIYGAVQTEQIEDTVADLQSANAIDVGVYNSTRPFLIAIPIILAFCTIIMGFIAWKLKNEFAWVIYKQVSASLDLKRRYLTFQIYVALLKFDFFFFLGFTIQFVVIVGGRDNVERYLTVAAIPVTIIILLLAAWFTIKENVIGSICVIILYFCGLGYFIFKLARMYDPAHMGPYLPARTELTTFAVLTILLILTTIVVACMCVHNYKKGLSEVIGNRKAASDPSGEMANGGSAYAPYTTEMVNDPNRPDVKPGQYQSQRFQMEID